MTGLFLSTEKPRSDDRNGNGNSCAGRYEFGFNGKLKDNEVAGSGNWQDYGMRVYNPRLARFPSVDPLTAKYPELTPYQFASNTPIQAIDLDGLEQYHYSLSFNKDGKSQIQKTDDTHLKYEHWRWGSANCLGVSIPVPEHYFTEDHRWVVHTGKVHEGLTPDNSAVYRMEITREFDSEKEMNSWVDGLKPSDLQRFDDNYSTLDQVGHYANIVQEEYQDTRPGRNYRGVSSENLTPEQQQSLKRFNRKKPANSSDVDLNANLHTGEVEMSTTSPGRVPGSKAVYNKSVNKKGVTTGMVKTTYDPQGKQVHAKDKMAK